MLVGSDKVETNIEQCPLCGTELSRVKFREIQSKIHEGEQRTAAELAQAQLATRQRLEQQFKLDLEKQTAAANKKAKEEAEQTIKAVAAERDQATMKLKEAQEHEAEIRKHAKQELEKGKIAAEKKANEEAERQIKKVVAERDQVAKKLKDVQERDAELLKQTRQDAEKQRQKELADQRQVLEKDKTLTLLKQQSEFNRERESLQRKLQRKTANELGDGAEIDVFEALRESFHGDKITRIRKGQPGADILHEVFYKGEPCGKMILDSKNRQSWQNAFVTKLRQDQVEAGAEHAILATTVFPAGKNEMCIEAGVIVMAPARIVYVAQILRQAMITMHVKGLSLKERTTKMSRLYKLITSESYSGKFAEANKLTHDILELEVQEQTAHGNVWKKRGALLKRVQNVLRETETEVSAIIESSDEEEAPRAFSVKSVRDVAAGVRNQETI
jgi:hypothetical protein